VKGASIKTVTTLTFPQTQEKATLTSANPASLSVCREDPKDREAVALISEIKIRNFKSLENVDLKLGHFNLLVGANASGKSNFLDALRFLQGVGSGFSLDEILDGKPPTDTTRRWPGIRGGSRLVSFRRKDGSPAKKTDFEIELSSQETPEGITGNLNYKLSFDTTDYAVAYGDESISGAEQGLMVHTPKQDERNDSRSASKKVIVSPSQMNVLSLIARVDDIARMPGLNLEKARKVDEKSTPADITMWALREMSKNFRDIQFLDPSPAVLRGYSSKVERMSESGEGFAALIHEIASNGSKPALLEWLKELRPDEVDDISALEGLNNDYMVAIKEGNKEFRAPVLSEGTLRFIALAAAFFQPSMPKVLVIEEIEKGLHPSRLRLLLELMRSQSKRTGTQVFATTHSPTLLNWLTEEDRKTTFVCTRDAKSGATKMRSLSEVPKLEELIQKNYNLDQLFEEGWLESALHES
jgi:ABC-type cobalamin/Fe3+-siderophores transport system ATPase subunit